MFGAGRHGPRRAPALVALSAVEERQGHGEGEQGPGLARGAVLDLLAADAEADLGELSAAGGVVGIRSQGLDREGGEIGALGKQP